MIKFTLEQVMTEEDKNSFGYHHYLEGVQKATAELQNGASLNELVPAILYAVNSFGYYIGEARMRRILETFEYSEEEWLEEEKEKELEAQRTRDAEYSDDGL